MRNEDFEAKMRAMEYFHTLKAPLRAWIVIRVDGRGFTRLTSDTSLYDKPFDEVFRDSMVHTATRLMDEMKAIYAYTESDEISLLFARDWNMFDREIEKIVSVSAGIASSEFTAHSTTTAHFDSRIWLGIDAESVIDYFRWRQSDARRCSLNGWGYWTLREEGLNKSEATRQLDGKSMEYKLGLLTERGIDFEKLPAWQRCGIGIYWEEYTKVGHNPITGEDVTAVRRRLRTDYDLPTGDDYASLISRLMMASQL